MTDQDYEDEDYHWGPWGGYEGDDELPEDCDPPMPSHTGYTHLDECVYDQSKGG